MKGLEKITNVYNAADNEVRRWFTKRSQEISDKVMSKILFPLSLLGTAGAFGGVITAIHSITGNEYLAFLGNVGAIFLTFPENIYNGSLLTGKKELNQAYKESEVVDELSLTNDINRPMRFPILIAGIATTGYLGYKAFDTFINGNSNAFSEEEIRFAGGCLSLATSMYLKDTDPKLLEKDSAWKRGYKTIKEKMKSYLPQPTPIPVPAKINAEKARF